MIQITLSFCLCHNKKDPIVDLLVSIVIYEHDGQNCSNSRKELENLYRIVQNFFRCTKRDEYEIRV